MINLNNEGIALMVAIVYITVNSLKTQLTNFCDKNYKSFAKFLFAILITILIVFVFKNSNVFKSDFVNNLSNFETLLLAMFIGLLATGARDTLIEMTTMLFGRKRF